MAAELATQTNGNVAVLEFTQDKIELIKRTVAVGATNDELAIFLHQCKRTGLDPLAKQIYCIKRKGKMTIQTGIDGFRLVADRTGLYAGSDDPAYDDEDEPSKATVTVYKLVQGIRCPFTATARWNEYFPGEDQSFMWRKMPCLMLSKCAESLALRKAFPQELSGVYTADEMEQAGPPQPPATKPPSDVELKAELLRTGWSWKQTVDALNQNYGTAHVDTTKPAQIAPAHLADFYAWLCTQPSKPAPEPTKAPDTDAVYRTLKGTIAAIKSITGLSEANRLLKENEGMVSNTQLAELLRDLEAASAKLANL